MTYVDNVVGCFTLYATNKHFTIPSFSFFRVDFLSIKIVRAGLNNLITNLEQSSYKIYLELPAQ